VDAIHFAYCLESICPFKKKYLSVLQNEFPEMEFVHGSHEPLGEEQAAEMGRFIHEGLCNRPMTMADVAEKRSQH
jgi:hypothetical protein